MNGLDDELPCTNWHEELQQLYQISTDDHFRRRKPSGLQEILFLRKLAEYWLFSHGHKSSCPELLYLDGKCMTHSYALLMCQDSSAKQTTDPSYRKGGQLIVQYTSERWYRHMTLLDCAVWGIASGWPFKASTTEIIFDSFPLRRLATQPASSCQPCAVLTRLVWWSVLYWSAKALFSPVFLLCISITEGQELGQTAVREKKTVRWPKWIRWWPQWLCNCYLMPVPTSGGYQLYMQSCGSV